MIALALLLLQTSQAPVLAFPEAGVDDTAAYQGYRTRFYRDSKGNTVQVYLEPRGGRVVNLWADADDESLGFTVRDAAGRPVRLAWQGDSAVTADSGGVRTLEYRLATGAPSVTLGWFLLGTMRVERDFQYDKRHLRPYDAPAFHVAEESLLVANVARLGGRERSRQLELLHADSLGALRSRLLPTLTGACSAASCGVRVERPSLDGRSRLALDLGVDPGAASMRRAGRTVSVRSRSQRPVVLTIRIATDAASLTPIARDSMFNREFLAFVGEERGRDSTSAAARRLEREVRSVELLSSEQKLMAGLPNFATYFGRDMMMAALMMRPIWRPAMSEHVIASVLRKLSPRGDVSHEEALGGQAIRENAAGYNAVMSAYFRATGRPGTGHADSAALAACDTAPNIGDLRLPMSTGDTAVPATGPPTPTWSAVSQCALDRADAILAGLRRTRENYHMLDDELQLPILEARYLADTAVARDRKRSFLLEREAGAPPRLTLLLRELALVAAETQPYVSDPTPANLIGFVKRDSTHWRSSSWRDSDAGYANGRYAMDINAIWAPRALEAMNVILSALPGLGIGREMLDSLAPEALAGPLAAYLADSSTLRRAAGTWYGARRHFVVTLDSARIARAIAAKLAWLPASERAYWRQVAGAPDSLRDSLTFLALSLDSAGAPIAVVNTDPATELFLDATSGRPGQLEAIEAFLQPYPFGLFVGGLGPLVANDAYAERRVWDTFAKDPYHGPRVVWGREVNLLLLGLSLQTGAGPDAAVNPRTPRASAALQATLDAVRASGLEHSELWSYRIEGGRLRPTRYGTSSDVQLWSSTDLAVQYLLSRIPHR